MTIIRRLSDPNKQAMTEQDELEAMTKAELIIELRRYRDQSHISESIITLVRKIAQINKQFDDTTVDITSEEDATFRNFVSWGKELVKINETIDALFDRIDPSKQMDVRRKAAQAAELSLEGIIKGIKKKGTTKKKSG